MIRTLTTTEAADLLLQDDCAAWSRGGAYALIEYLEEHEEESAPIEFDRVGIRCDFDEYSSATEAAANYDFTPEPDDDEETTEAKALEYLEDNTQVIQFDGGIIIQAW